MGFLIAILNVLIVLGSLFMICIILIQRGKGGGLAGAFGGVGGSSAFGTKAGDVFTRITIGVAAVWFILSMLLVVLTNRERTSAFNTGGGMSAESPLDDLTPKGKTGKSPSPTGTDSGADIPLPPID